MDDDDERQVLLLGIAFDAAMDAGHLEAARNWIGHV
jgi:hypothetical protein